MYSVNPDILIQWGAECLEGAEAMNGRIGA